MEKKGASINHATASKCYTAFVCVTVIAVILAVLAGTKNQNFIIGMAYIAFAIISYHWAGALNKNKWLWVLISIIPGVNLISMLVLVNTTHKICKADGLKLGFFGGIDKQES